MTGIYQITWYTGHFYIGRCKNFKLRMSRHKCDMSHDRHSSQFVQRTFNKYGEPVSFELIEECSYDVIQEREQYYLDKHYNDRNCLNTSPHSSGGSPKGRKSPMKGRKLSDAHKAALSEGFKKHERTEKQRQTSSNNMKIYWEKKRNPGKISSQNRKK